MTRLLFLLLLLISTAAGARMYQWLDPHSKSMQFSGVPPAWFRGLQSGPRVRVYDGGKLIDDTTIPLSLEDDRSMRDMAFRALEEEQQLEAIKRLERAALRQARREALKAQAGGEQSDTIEAPPEVLPESLDADEVSKLKAILAEFDRTSGTTVAPLSTKPPPPASATTGTASTYGVKRGQIYLSLCLAAAER
jgi:hypothetical protein